MRKHFDVIALVITALTVLLAVAFMHGEQLGIQPVVDADAEGHSDDRYFTDNDLNLSVLLKIKGNVLEKPFDKVNARIYWTQALRLNPDDEELKGRLQ